MSFRLQMVPDPQNSKGCELALYPADSTGLTAPRANRKLDQIGMIQVLLSIGREDLARTFLEALIRRESYDALISDDEAARVFRF